MTSRSVHGEPVYWEGRPREVRPTPLLRVVGYLAYGLGLVSMAFAIVRSTSLGDTSPATLLFALWSVTLGALAHGVPTWWLGGATYRVTANHVIWIRGPFRRSIERGAISYARILWSPRLANVGTLELIRSVPTGALHRRLALRLEGIESPTGVWAIIRDAHDVASAGHGDLPIAQRLDRGERILWAARPLPTLRAYLPMGSTQWSLVAVMLGLFGIGITMSWRGLSILARLSSAGLDSQKLPFVALILGMGLAVLCVFFVGFFIGQTTLLHRARTLRQTHYLISNKRVLIQRGREELHLDRRMIVEVIETPAGAGTRNLFLVLDGPHARALASSGAFGEKTDHTVELVPVFEWVQDGDGARHALERHPPSLPPLPWAA
jgi:hypothetical protein